MNEKAQDALSLEEGNVPDPGAKARLLTFDLLDRRTTAYRRVMSIEAAIANDLGGADALSAAQMALARRAAVLTAMLDDYETRWAAGEVAELPGYLAAINALRRVLVTLGLERRAKAVPSLKDYLAARSQDDEEDDDARE